MTNEVLTIEMEQGEFNPLVSCKELRESISKTNNIEEMYLGEFKYKGVPNFERGIYTDDFLYLDMSIDEITEGAVYIIADDVVIGKAVHLERFLYSEEKAVGIYDN